MTASGMKKKDKPWEHLPIIGRLPKKYVLAAVYLIAAIVVILILTYHNPNADPATEALKRNCSIVLIVLAIALFTAWYDRLMVLPVELYNSRRLIIRLSANDFKKRYAGSYMGIIWAFVQPAVTVVMYWIVFDFIFSAKSQMAAGGVDVPYVLFLTTGLCPWFFFMDALNGGTASLLEYNYLVKKVVFKISVLPLIKVISAFFVHVFFVGLTLLLSLAYGRYPDIYWLQIPYYMICLFVLSLSICYTTCAVNVFLRDLSQLISIGLQVFQWATPILWDINGVRTDLRWILKLNPMTYIVEGYRDAVYGENWFFEHFYSSTYFWLCTVALFIVGSLIFKRTKVHFADVL